jgi:hypothetical protein
LIDDIGDIAGFFNRSKLNPALGAAWSAHKGFNIIGEPTSWAKEAVSLPVPMSLGSTYEILRDQKLDKGIPLVILSLLGDSVNSYPDRPKTADSLDDVLAKWLGTQPKKR